MATLVEAPPPATAAARKRGRSRLVWRNTVAGWSFILPNFIGFAVITLVPVGWLFYMSFTKWKPLKNTGTWIGAKNYTRLWHDTLFWIALKNTAYYAVVHIPLTMVAGLGLALLLNRAIKGSSFFRTAAFFPYITSTVAITSVWNLLFNPTFGPVNLILRYTGLEWLLGKMGADVPIGWMGSADWAMPTVILLGTWREMGYYMLLYLAGLQTIPKQLYEAATVDGATSWQRFWHVTLPGLRHVNFLVTVLLIIASFKIFDLILLMNNGLQYQSDLVLSQYIYQKAFVETDFGYGSAISVVLFAICFLLTIAQYFVNRRGDN